MKPSLFSLFILLLIKSLLVIWFISTNVIELGPDEAQYWTWSQQLDLGYYSKPPAIAWAIYLGTSIFGDNEMGVRFVAVLIGFFLPVAVYFLARGSRLSQNTAFWSAIAWAFSPLGLLASLLATTDGGMVLFWTLSSCVIVKALSSGKLPNYVLLGLFVAFGALFKWPIYLFWVVVLMAMCVFKTLRSYHALTGFLISLLGIFPSVIWNYQHQFATFKHVLTTISGGHGHELGTTPLFKGNLLEFLGAQVALLSPILFLLLILALVHMIKNVKNIWPSLQFSAAVTLLILFSYTGLSLFQKMQGNWCVFAYPTATLCLTWYACERILWGKKILVAGLIVSVVLTNAVFSIPVLQTLGTLPYKSSPFRHNVGWNQLKPALESAGYRPKEHFLFSHNYQMASLLSFYTEEKKRAYFFNLQGLRKNQFSYWETMPLTQKGKTGFFVLSQDEKEVNELSINAIKKQLENYFENVEFLGSRPLFWNGNTVAKVALIFKCLNYNGKEPKDPERY